MTEKQMIMDDELQREALQENLLQLVNDSDPQHCILIAFSKDHRLIHTYSYMTEELIEDIAKTAAAHPSVNSQLQGILQFLSRAVGSALMGKKDKKKLQ